MERTDLKVRIKFAGAAEQARRSGTGAATGRKRNRQRLSPGAATASRARCGGLRELHEVTRPIVGHLFTTRPRPARQPSSKVGDQVEIRQVLCIVEAMKLMKQTRAPSGRDRQAHRRNGQWSSSASPLFAIRHVENLTESVFVLIGRDTVPLPTAFEGGGTLVPP